MKSETYTEKKIRGKTISITEYESISDLMNDITEKDSIDLHKGFAQSLDTDFRTIKFTGTRNFEEATNLLVNGWDKGIKKINTMIKAKKIRTQGTLKAKNEIGMVGFQPIVPNYIMGLPNNMLGTKMRPVKQKVINIMKNVSYPGITKTEQIYEESIKSLEIIMALERAGYRINLYAMFGTRIMTSAYDHDRGDDYILFITKIKGANQRLNINKTVFPLCHSSFIRRIMFRAIETSESLDKILKDHVPERCQNSFRFSYGTPVREWQVNGLFKKDYYILPAVFDDSFSIDKIKSIEDLKDFKSVKFI